MPLPMKEECCCLCPLIDCPWTTATVTILGMTFQVDLPPTTLPDCCQRKTSNCEMKGPDFIRDCFDTQFDWNLINPHEFLTMDGPFCDWRTVITPGTAVDSCCGSTNYRVEWRGRIRFRFWFWIQARVKFTICYCKTANDKPGYKVKIEFEYNRATIRNTTRLIKYRNRKYTRVCCPPPGDDGPGGPEEDDPILPLNNPGDGYEPCVPGCYSDPPEPEWTDNSGDDIPAVPPLRHPRLQLIGCPEFLPELIPIFNPICIGTCDEENDLIPGCYDAGFYQIISDCELVDVNTCFGTGQIRMPSRWQVVGESPNTTSETGTIIWESGVLELTPVCTEDTGLTELTVKVSRAPLEWIITGFECKDEYGIDQGPYKIVIPQGLDVHLTRLCGEPIT